MLVSTIKININRSSPRHGQNHVTQLTQEQAPLKVYINGQHQHQHQYHQEQSTVTANTKLTEWTMKSSHSENRVVAAESSCCVCFVHTEDSTPCGHILCKPCLFALKTRACPICRRSLPETPALDYASLAQKACASGDLTLLQEAYRTVSSNNVSKKSKDALEARAVISSTLVQKLCDMNLTELSAASMLLPFQEPVVLSATFDRLESLGGEVKSVLGLLRWVKESDSYRDASLSASFGLKYLVDRLSQEAAQRVLPTLTLVELQAFATELGQLLAHPGTDQTILCIYIQEALLRNLHEGFDHYVARDFVSAARALASEELLNESQEQYVVSVFASRLSLAVPYEYMFDFCR